MKLRLLFLALVCTFLAACGGGDSSQDLTFQRVGLHRASFAEGNYVLRTQAEFNAAWNAAPQLLFGNPVDTVVAPPTIDFASNTVVGVSMGQDIVCHTLQIRKVTLTGDAASVEYWSNKEYGPTTLACVHPGYLEDFVVIPARPATVTFTRVAE